MPVVSGANTLGGRGSVFGTSRQAPFDRWFRYPAGFNAAALDLVLDPARNPGGGPVLDPFAGSGTVGTAALRRGWAFRGIEAHPEIAELAQLKLSEVGEPRELVTDAQALCDGLPAASDLRDVDAEAELVQRCFDPAVLRELAALRERVKASSAWTSRHLKWALLATLRDVANVKVGWPYLRPSLARTPPYDDVGQRFVARATWMAEDLAQRPSGADALVVHGDSRDARAWHGVSGSVCVTSPPYLNNFDYADATRLETYFWGRNTTWAELCSDVRAGMLVATTQQSSTAGAESALETLTETWPQLGSDVEALSLSLEHAGASRQRPKEYGRVLPQYVLGMQAVLAAMLKAVEPGGWCGWVIGDSAPYGVFVDTPALITNCAETHGYRSFETVHLRARGERWRMNGTRHQVTLSEKLVWFRAP